MCLEHHVVQVGVMMVGTRPRLEHNTDASWELRPSNRRLNHCAVAGSILGGPSFKTGHGKHVCRSVCRNARTHAHAQ